MIGLLLWVGAALAGFDPKCDGLAKPADYDDVVQSDFLQNFFALSATLSPVHGVVPHVPGRGALGVDVGIIPPLNCYQRAAYNYTKTEDTNASPFLPRLRATFAFPTRGLVAPYLGVAYMGPIPVGGLYNVTFGAELGVAFRVLAPVQPGLRVHGSLLRSVGEIAGPVKDGDPVVQDLYVGSTVGVDAMIAATPFTKVDLSPYLAVGFTDASTSFVVGDDGVIVANQHPYFGPTMSVGVDALIVDHVRIGAEIYMAPGGFSRPKGLGPETSDRGFGAYGHLYTGRLRIAWEFGGAKVKLGKKHAESGS